MEKFIGRSRGPSNDWSLACNKSCKICGIVVLTCFIVSAIVTLITILSMIQVSNKFIDEIKPITSGEIKRTEITRHSVLNRPAVIHTHQEVQQVSGIHGFVRLNNENNDQSSKKVVLVLSETEKPTSTVSFREKQLRKKKEQQEEEEEWDRQRAKANADFENMIKRVRQNTNWQRMSIF